MEDQEYIAVETAREQLGIGPKHMSMLLQAEALRYRTDPLDGLIKWVCAADVKDALEHLAGHKQEEEDLRRISFPASLHENKAHGRDDKLTSFTLTDSDLVTLLLATASYFDAERDIYFSRYDDRGAVTKTLAVVDRIYSRLLKGNAAGSNISDIVMEIYRNRPDEHTLEMVFLYLMSKAKLGKNIQRPIDNSDPSLQVLRRNATARDNEPGK
jgi:hypothetical protein